MSVPNFAVSSTTGILGALMSYAGEIPAIVAIGLIMLGGVAAAILIWLNEK